MGQAAKQLFQASLAASIGTLYTPPTVNGGRARITTLLLCNTDSSARDVTLSIVPAGGTAGTGNRIMDACTMPAKTLWALPECDIIIEPGATVQGLASTASVVTVTANGVEIT